MELVVQVFMVLALGACIAYGKKISVIHDKFIIGGEDATPGQFTYQVLLQRNSAFICGGTLLSSRIVLTAAHCVDGGTQASELTVVLGETIIGVNENTEQTIDVAVIEVHEGWNPSTLENDIAILTLAEDAILNNFVQPVDRIARAEDGKFTGETCTITGFGVSRVEVDAETEEIINTEVSNVLQEASIPVIRNRKCKRFFGDVIKSTNICVRLKDVGACYGDSGGPLVCQRDGATVLAGVTSFGNYACDKASVYTRVSKYEVWIESRMQ